jgi:PAS domain S-box-containing protein
MDFSLVTSEAVQEIFQSMSEGIIMVDESGIIAVANPMAEQMFGYNPGELGRKSLEELLPHRYRGTHASFRHGFNAHPEPRRMGIGRDLTGLRKDGKEFPVEISLSYTRVKGKLFIMAFISDISLRKKTEDALKRSEEQLIVYATELEQKVQARTEALHKSIARLEEEVTERKKAEEEAQRSLEKERELNELKSKFVSIASHEFRTPLSTVLSSASLIQQYKDKGDLEKVDKHIDRIKSSVNQLTMILNDFLSLGKLEEGKIDVNTERINIGHFIHEIIEEVQSFLKEGQTITFECEPGIDEIQSDSRILRNIMFNLISNASKYSDIRKPIQLTCAKRNGQILLGVKDHGIGIPKGDHKHLFDRFFRASNAGQVQGTGLGLNIVKRYADLVNGKIDFTSDYGFGSTFTVLLPDNSNPK